MSIYKHSRYIETPAYYSEGSVLTFDIRRRKDFSKAKGTYYMWKETDTMDYLAFKHYGSHSLWWVLLDANPKYQSELEIKSGDIIFIPDKSEIPKEYA